MNSKKFLSLDSNSKRLFFMAMGIYTGNPGQYSIDTCLSKAIYNRGFYPSAEDTMIILHAMNKTIKDLDL
jgi:hypothetical protein